MNQSYQDQACADVDEYIPTSGTSLTAVGDRRSTLFNPKFITPSSPKPIAFRNTSDSPPDVETPSVTHHGTLSPLSSMARLEAHQRESIDTVRITDDIPQPIGQMRSFQKSLTASRYQPSQQFKNPRRMNPSKTEPFLQIPGRNVFTGSRDNSMRTPSPPSPIIQPTDADNYLDSKSYISKGGVSVGGSRVARFAGKIDGIQEKQYAKVLKEIMSDTEDSDRRKLLSPEQLRFIENYENQRTKQRTLAQRLETSTQQRETKQTMLTQMDDLEKYRECTFSPTLESKQIPDRSLEEFLESQGRHLMKKEQKMQQIQAQRFHEENELNPHKPQTLQKSAILAKNREKSPFQRLYSIKNNNLKKQAAKMIQEESDEEDRSVVSSKKKLKEEVLHHPQINQKSKKIKRNQPIGEYLYKQAERKTSKQEAQPAHQTQSFINLKSQKMLVNKFKGEFKRAMQLVMQMASERAEEQKNALDDPPPADYSSSLEKQPLAELLVELGYLNPVDKEGQKRELTAKEQSVISELFELTRQNKTDSVVETNLLYQILSALSGFLQQYLHKKPNVASPLEAKQKRANEFSPVTDHNEQTMTLHYYDEIRGSTDKPEGQVDSSQQMAFQPIVSNLQDRFDSLNQISKDNIFTVEGKLQLNENAARRLTQRFAMLQKNRREFERKRKLEEDMMRDKSQLIKASQEDSFRPQLSQGSQQIIQNKLSRLKLEGDESRAGEQRQMTVEQDSLDVYSPKQSSRREQTEQEESSMRVIQDSKRGPVSGKKLMTSKLNSIPKAQHRLEKIKKEQNEKFEQECTFKPKRMTSTKSTSNLQSNVRTTERLYNLAKKGQEREEMFEKKREELQRQREEAECTFKPSLQKSTSMSVIKNPYWSKNVDETVTRLKQARKQEEDKKRQLSRGVPGYEHAPGKEPKLNFSLEKSFKPSFNDLIKSPKVPKKKERQKRGRVEESRNDAKRLGGKSQERFNELLNKGTQKAKVVALKMQIDPEDSKNLVTVEQEKGTETHDLNQWTGSAQQRKFLPTISSNETEQSQTGAQTSNSPLLYVDIALNDEKTHRILVYSGDRPEDLASEFAEQHSKLGLSVDLDSSMKQQLERLIYTKIAAVFQHMEYRSQPSQSEEHSE